MVDEKPEAVEQVQEKDCSAAGSEETSGNAKSLGVFSFEGDMSLAQDIPLGRFALPIEVADLAWYLAGSQSSYLTAQVISLDGGYL